MLSVIINWLDKLFGYVPQKPSTPPMHTITINGRVYGVRREVRKKVRL